MAWPPTYQGSQYGNYALPPYGTSGYYPSAPPPPPGAENPYAKVYTEVPEKFSQPGIQPEYDSQYDSESEEVTGQRNCNDCCNFTCNISDRTMETIKDVGLVALAILAVAAYFTLATFAGIGATMLDPAFGYFTFSILIVIPIKIALIFGCAALCS